VTAVRSPEAGPAVEAGPVDGGATPSADDCFPVPNRELSPVRDRRSVWRDRRVIVVSAVAGAALAGGLAWLVAPGGSGVPSVSITAHHSRFEPDRIDVKAGSTVRFVVHNADPIDHEFIIGPPETHDIHERGLPHFHNGAVAGEITVPAGSTVETFFTFGPSGSNAVEYGCHLAGHWAYGMHGKALIR
jgi:uncharacterized cupredoxin-like copper-binding protein